VKAEESGSIHPSGNRASDSHQTETNKDSEEEGGLI
jgi:hypothetical protein